MAEWILDIASASRATESGLISSLVTPITLTLIFTACALPLDAEQRDNMKIKSASLLLVPLGISGIPQT